MLKGGKKRGRLICTDVIRLERFSNCEKNFSSLVVRTRRPKNTTRNHFRFGKKKSSCTCCEFTLWACSYSIFTGSYTNWRRHLISRTPTDISKKKKKSTILCRKKKKHMRWDVPVQIRLQNRISQFVTILESNIFSVNYTRDDGIGVTATLTVICFPNWVVDVRSY